LLGGKVIRLRNFVMVGLGAAAMLALSGCVNMGEYFLSFSDEQCAEEALRLVTWVENVDLVTSAAVSDVVAQELGDKYCHMQMDVEARAGLTPFEVIQVHDDVLTQIDGMYLFTWDSPVVIHSGTCTIEVGQWDASSREAFGEPDPACLP
jgi:hypothetical protein